MSRFLAVAVSGLVSLVSHRAGAEPKSASDAGNAAIRGYIRPYLGWGWKVVTAPADERSWYRLGWGVSSGVAVTRLSFGFDFNYFNGTPIYGQLNSNPSVSGEGRMNAFRLAIDVSYDVLCLKWFTFKPHVVGGVEWRRLTIGDAYTGVRRSAFWAPGVIGLVPIRADGRFAVGSEARLNMILIDGTIYTHFSGFIVAESRF